MARRGAWVAATLMACLLVLTTSQPPPDKRLARVAERKARPVVAAYVPDYRMASIDWPGIGVRCAGRFAPRPPRAHALTPVQRKARAAETILERTKRNRRETGLGISDCDLLGEDMFGWCWCVDDAPARLALRTRAELPRHRRVLPLHFRVDNSVQPS